MFNFKASYSWLLFFNKVCLLNNTIKTFYSTPTLTNWSVLFSFIWTFFLVLKKKMFYWNLQLPKMGTILCCQEVLSLVVLHMLGTAFHGSHRAWFSNWILHFPTPPPFVFHWLVTVTIPYTANSPVGVTKSPRKNRLFSFSHFYCQN